LPQRLLVAQDNQSLAYAIACGLESAGFAVDTETDGMRALDLFHEANRPFDVIILNLILPSLGGLEICREIRRFSTVPIIMVSARPSVIDLIVGLECGADEFVQEPFEIREIEARIRALLRRASWSSAGTLYAKKLEIDPATFRVRKNGHDISLTAIEFRLLLALARRPRQIFTREVLVERVWNQEYFGDSRRVDMAVGRLRAKLEDDPGRPLMIKTVRGVGYCFDDRPLR
jgi:two-component system, OmpR family, response regulator MtrA